MNGDKMDFEDHMLVLDWSQECLLSEYEDPYYFLTETSGNIRLRDPLQDTDCVIGKFNLFYLDLESMTKEGMAALVFDALDTRSQTIVYYDPIFDKCEPFFSEAVNAVFDSIYLPNLLILDRLEILPEHRGRSAGLLVMRELIRRFGQGAGIVAIKPFPLQFEISRPLSELDEWDKSMRFDELPRNEWPASRKLERYYARLGFKRLGGTPLMILSTSEKLPSAQSLTRSSAGSAMGFQSSTPRPT